MGHARDDDIVGHEFMGEVVEVGKTNKKLKVCDRVVVGGFGSSRRKAAVGLAVGAGDGDRFDLRPDPVC